VRDLLEIRNQALSTLLADFSVCHGCAVVDRNKNRIQVGTPCPECSIPSKGATAYFHLEVVTLIDLMQEIYHSSPSPRQGSQPSRSPKRDHQLAVVIFFCTLGEVLLGHFLREAMIALNLPKGVIDRLLSDHQYAKQRIEKVFPSVTGRKWKKTVEQLSSSAKLDYSTTVDFYLQAVEARNKFLHDGVKWAIPEGMPEKCMRTIGPLLNLFVALHNMIVCETYRQQKRS
jgi:hypothetical protein